MNEAAEAEFVDLVYDAAMDSTLWVPVMEKLADLIGGTSGWMSQLDVASGEGGGPTSRVDPVFPGRYRDHYAQCNPLSLVRDTRSYVREWDLRVLTDDEWMAKDALVRGEYYAGFLKPQDVHSILMFRLGLRGLEVSAISINRPEHWGRFEAANLEVANRLHPHLIRAFKIAERFGDAFAVESGLNEALDRSSHGIFVLSADGRVRHANATAQAMMRSSIGLQVREGRLRTATPRDAEPLRRLIAIAGGLEGGPPAAGAMALQVPGRRLPLSITATPVRREQVSLFGSGPSVLVAVTDLETPTSVAETTLQQVFGLTPAERRVALSLLAGPTLQEAAAELGVSVNTAREHLAHIFDKTGVSRQSQLVSLMLKTVGPFPLA